MALTTALLQAASTLEVDASADAPVIKAAYRKLLATHPPDRDPDGFRRIRSAYELLKDPAAGAREALQRPFPAVDPPALRATGPTPSGATALAVLRHFAGRMDARALLAAGSAEDKKEPQ